MMKVSDIRKYFMTELAYENYVTDKTGVKTIEMIGAQFVADEPAIFGKVDEDYVKRELDWYRSMSLNVNDIPGGPPKIWQQVADKNGQINSNYGWCIWSTRARPCRKITMIMACPTSCAPTRSSTSSEGVNSMRSSACVPMMSYTVTRTTMPGSSTCSSASRPISELK